MFNFFKTILGISNEAEIKKLQKIADKVLALEDKYSKMNDADLTSQTNILKNRLSKGETLDDILPDAFAVVREAAFRSVEMKPYPVQVIGGIVLHQGRIAEMKTGEGKTLVATMPAYLNALLGKGVHIVTVNDYLAKRDSEWMGKIYRFLGLSVGVIIHDLNNEQRRAAYNCDITYGTNNEFGFDYLRDNMVMYAEEMVQRGHPYVIIDEVDSILIDEARTPLIISGQGEQSSELYTKADQFVVRLTRSTHDPTKEVSRFQRDETITPDGDFVVDEKNKTVTLTEQGAKKAEKAFGVENLNDIDNTDLHHHILQALKANAIMKKDVDYVVKNDEVIIVDEFTGRLMLGRRYSDGLHQAIEAKERVKVARESKTLATITFQNYFRLYAKLSGMTGTAKTEEDEFQNIYKLDVVQIPTNKPNIRKDLNDVIYKNKNAKFNNVVEEIVRRNKLGQPVLVGTINVETSEKLSTLLSRRGIQHEVLNAKHHEREAQIVAQAGHVGAVTIATNMAGRGTDILLGGNPDFLARRELRKLGHADDIIEEATGHNENAPQEVLDLRKQYISLLNNFKKETDIEHNKVMSLGGLHIIGTERHESRRIDNQLMGRAARQGDPGSTQFFISLEDDVMRLFGSDRIMPIVERMGLGDDEPLEARLLTKQVENAQKNIEGRHFEARKHVLQFDDVMNQQRGIIYKQRQQVLQGEDMAETIQNMVESVIDDAIAQSCSGEAAFMWDFTTLKDYLEKICIKPGTILKKKPEMEEWDNSDLKKWLVAEAKEFYKERENLFIKNGIDVRETERIVLLNSVNHRWMDHIDDMDQLREGISLRAYAQKDPVIEYKLESYDMFDEMVRLIREDTVKKLYQARLVAPPTIRRENIQNIRENKKGDRNSTTSRGSKLTSGQTGMNQLCPCGSGKKYKHCCGKK
ncbi:MAG: preprotein translocase subunit SecA [Christensenellaceae bacterium]|nr:preprotein translocase subunit SecA [Christensenellaceae bacterium]